MLNEKSRPFYQSAQLYELKKLPHDELVGYLMDQFKRGGKRCPEQNAEKISLLSQQNPYYAQKPALNVYFILSIALKITAPPQKVSVDNQIRLR